eukprot:241605_1
MSVHYGMDIVCIYIHYIYLQGCVRGTALSSSSCASYVLQYVVLLAMLWRRLCITFEGSPFAVSNRTKCIFWVTYGLQIFFAMMCLAGAVYLPLWSIIYPIIAICALLVLMSTLVGLFLFKLLVMSRICENTQTATVGRKDDLRLGLVTKLFILTVASIVSILSYFAMSVVVTAIGIGTNVYFRFLSDLSHTMDVFTNFLSIVLGIPELNHVYMNLFGFCQMRCVKCWKNKIQMNSSSQLSQVIGHKTTIELDAVSLEVQMQTQPGTTVI